VADVLGCAKCRPGAQLLPELRLAGELLTTANRASSPRASTPTSRRRNLFPSCRRMWRRQPRRPTPRHCRCRRQFPSRRECHRRPAHRSSRVRKRICLGVWQVEPAGIGSGTPIQACAHVKTFVGSEWCPFGTQEFAGLGIKSRRRGGAPDARQVKMGRLGMPAQLREATCRTSASSASESCYELTSPGAGM